MKLIFFLGNPGKDYNFTRHNFAFLAADFYAKTHGDLKFKPQPKFFADTLKIDQLVLAKPQTFYNGVSQSFQALCHFYKLNVQNDVLVVCDDFNLDFGTLRWRQNGSAGGNNGLKSIITVQPDGHFQRLRLGTGNTELRQKLGDIKFVLSPFTAAERAELAPILLKISNFIDSWSENQSPQL